MASKKPAPTKPAHKKAASKKAASRTPARTAPTAPAKAGARAPAAKPDGAAPVRAYIAKQRAEHRAILQALDALIAKQVPEARRALKWGAPFWGVEGRGWFLSAASFKNYVKLNFFAGVHLKPALPVVGTAKEMRAVHYATLAELDERQLASWLKQAASIPGWGK